MEGSLKDKISKSSSLPGMAIDQSPPALPEIQEGSVQDGNSKHSNPKKNSEDKQVEAELVGIFTDFGFENGNFSEELEPRETLERAQAPTLYHQTPRFTISPINQQTPSNNNPSQVVITNPLKRKFSSVQGVPQKKGRS